MYRIEGYIILNTGDKFKISNPPTKELTGYDVGHEFIKAIIKTIEKQHNIKIPGYMFTLIKEEEE